MGTIYGNGSDDIDLGAPNPNPALLLAPPTVPVVADGLPFPSFASSLSASDRANLVGLCDNDVRTWCAARADEHRRSALALLSIYNSTAPIHRLPPEILSKIFEGCWTDRKSLQIGHVCHQWRSVLLSTTAFWVRAVDGDKFSPDKHSIAYLGATLERSAPRAVEPSFRRFSASLSHCLSAHAGRVASLVVSVAEEDGLFALLASLSSGMPCLGALTIAFDKDGDPQNPSWTNNPRLESLSPPILPHLTRLTAPPFLFPILAVPSLRHITLKALYEHHSYDGLLGSLLCFRGALEICSHSVLSLRLFRASFWAELQVSLGMVSLPVLHDLEIAGTTSGCMLILARLKLPNTTRIHCTAVNNGSLLSILSTQPEPIYSYIRATDRVEICGTPDTVSMRFYSEDDPEGRLYLGVAGVGQRLCFYETIDIFLSTGRARVRELMVSRLDPEDVPGVAFRAFPNLAHLVVSGETAIHVLRNLVSRWVDHNKVVVDQVLSLGLETLTVDFHPAASRGLAAALRNGDLALVEDDLRTVCIELECILWRRAQEGATLTRLEFGCTCTDESGQTGTDSGGHKVCILDPTGPGWVSWRPIVEPLERLVDGPVVFTGYRFFIADQ